MRSPTPPRATTCCCRRRHPPPPGRTGRGPGRCRRGWRSWRAAARTSIGMCTHFWKNDLLMNNNNIHRRPLPPTQPPRDPGRPGWPLPPPGMVHSDAMIADEDASSHVPSMCTVHNKGWWSFFAVKRNTLDHAWAPLFLIEFAVDSPREEKIIRGQSYASSSCAGFTLGS